MIITKPFTSLLLFFTLLLIGNICCAASLTEDAFSELDDEEDLVEMQNLYKRTEVETDVEADGEVLSPDKRMVEEADDEVLHPYERALRQLEEDELEMEARRARKGKGHKKGKSKCIHEW